MTACRPSYLELGEHYEACLAAHGDTHRGVDWPDADDATTRYRVMLGLLDRRPRPADASLLDFGCGAGHLVDHLRRHGLDVRCAWLQRHAQERRGDGHGLRRHLPECLRAGQGVPHPDRLYE